MKEYCVYIMASKKDGVIYIGVTGNLKKRVYQHRNGLVQGFTQRYQVKRLVYFELGKDIDACLKREKQMKAWRREWKVELFERKNPEWNDLWHLISC